MSEQFVLNCLPGAVPDEDFEAAYRIKRNEAAKPRNVEERTATFCTQPARIDVWLVGIIINLEPVGRPTTLVAAGNQTVWGIPIDNGVPESNYVNARAAPPWFWAYGALLCFCPVGLVSIYFSCKTAKANADGDLVAAYRYSLLAQWCSVGGMFLGIVLLLATFLLIV